MIELEPDFRTPELIAWGDRLCKLSNPKYLKKRLKKITQDELCKELGCCPKTLRKYLRYHRLMAMPGK